MGTSATQITIPGGVGVADLHFFAQRREERTLSFTREQHPADLAPEASAAAKDFALSTNPGRMRPGLHSLGLEFLTRRFYARKYIFREPPA
jgi:hypothetical protein